MGSRLHSVHLANAGEPRWHGSSGSSQHLTAICHNTAIICQPSNDMDITWRWDERTRLSCCATSLEHHRCGVPASLCGCPQGIWQHKFRQSLHLQRADNCCYQVFASWKFMKIRHTCTYRILRYSSILDFCEAGWWDLCFSREMRTTHMGFRRAKTKTP